MRRATLAAAVTLCLALLALPALGQEPDPEPVAELRDAIAQVRAARASHSTAILYTAIAGATAIGLRQIIQGVKRVRADKGAVPLSPGWARALPWILGALGLVYAIVAAIAGGLDPLTATLVGVVFGPGALVAHQYGRSIRSLLDVDPIQEDRRAMEDTILRDSAHMTQAAIDQLSPGDRRRSLDAVLAGRAPAPITDRGAPVALLLAVAIGASTLSGCAALDRTAALADWRARVAEQVNIWNECRLPALVDVLGQAAGHAADEVIAQGTAYLVGKLLRGQAVDPIGWLEIGRELWSYIKDRWVTVERPAIARCIAARAARAASEIELRPGEEAGAVRVRTQAGEVSPLAGARWLTDNPNAWARE